MKLKRSKSSLAEPETSKWDSDLTRWRCSLHSASKRIWFATIRICAFWIRSIAPQAWWWPSCVTSMLGDLNRLEQLWTLWWYGYRRYCRGLQNPLCSVGTWWSGPLYCLKVLERNKNPWFKTSVSPQNHHESPPFSQTKSTMFPIKIAITWW